MTLPGGSLTPGGAGGSESVRASVGSGTAADASAPDAAALRSEKVAQVKMVSHNTEDTGVGGRLFP